MQAENGDFQGFVLGYSRPFIHRTKAEKIGHGIVGAVVSVNRQAAAVPFQSDDAAVARRKGKEIMVGHPVDVVLGFVDDDNLAVKVGLQVVIGAGKGKAQNDGCHFDTLFFQLIDDIDHGAAREGSVFDQNQRQLVVLEPDLFDLFINQVMAGTRSQSQGNSLAIKQAVDLDGKTAAQMSYLRTGADDQAVSGNAFLRGARQDVLGQLIHVDYLDVDLAVKGAINQLRQLASRFAKEPVMDAGDFKPQGLKDMDALGPIKSQDIGFGAGKRFVRVLAIYNHDLILLLVETAVYCHAEQMRKTQLHRISAGFYSSAVVRQLADEGGLYRKELCKELYVPDIIIADNLTQMPV